MKRLYLLLSLALLSSCSSASSSINSNQNTSEEISSSSNVSDISISSQANNIPTLNNEYYREFSLDNVISSSLGDIHYNVRIPSSYDGTKPYALFFTLPGYQGLYRFGIGINLRTEDFAFEVQKYVDDMIIVAPQLNDWGLTSARQTIELVHYFKDNYNIDTNRIFAEGYSGGGETMSIAMGIEPNLFTKETLSLFPIQFN